MRVIDPETNVEYKLYFAYDIGEGPFITEAGRVLQIRGLTEAVLSETADDEDKFWARAYCSEYDQYTKAAGRTVALRKLTNQLSKPFRTAVWDAVRESGLKLASVAQR
jgi:hypothetical protein